MAEAVIAWMLALNHRVFEKDRLAREDRWSEADAYNGTELRDQTLGLVGPSLAAQIYPLVLVIWNLFVSWNFRERPFLRFECCRLAPRAAQRRGRLRSPRSWRSG